MSKTIEPHTCSEWNPKTDELCAKPANYLLEVEADGLRTTNWKCSYHIRRYSARKLGKGVRVIITATKDGKNANT